MLAIELCCALIVALYLVVKATTARAPRRFLARMAVLAVAAWLGENSVIEAYGFYVYSSEWSVIIDHVPLLIILIWPVVIHSAWDLARALLPNGSAAVPFVTSLVVLADASLIEPIAVASGLWWWTEPGLFGVPLIGIVGWALFAGIATWWFERARGALRLGVVMLAPLGTHFALLALWWGGFRWFHAEVQPWPVVGSLWLLSLWLAARSSKGRWRQRVPVREMLLRAPGAGFFFVLLALHVRDFALIAYALAFAPPYLSLINLGARALERRSSHGVASWPASQPPASP